MSDDRSKTLGDEIAEVNAAFRKLAIAIRDASPTAARFAAAIARLESLKPKSPWPFPAARRWWRRTRCRR